MLRSAAFCLLAAAYFATLLSLIGEWAFVQDKLLTLLTLYQRGDTIFFRHTSQKILIYILTTLALKTNHISNYLLPLWGNVL